MSHLSRSARSRLLEVIVLKSWWVLLFFFACFFAYDQAVRQKEKEEASLKKRYELLLEEKRAALALYSRLQLELASSEDPEFIEMVLMEKLGLVPEGSIKLLFVP